jgi:lipoprotein NlpD
MIYTLLPGRTRGRCAMEKAVVLVLLCVLSGCGGHVKAPIEDRRGGSPGAPVYTVQRGDTLYSIAFRYGLDYRKVAAGNGMSAPYTIYPGQKLKLREAEVVASSRASTKPAASRPTTRTGKPASSTYKTPAPIAKVPAVKPSSPKPSVASAPRPMPKPAPVPSSSSAGMTKGTPAWRWPSSGRVVRRYSSSVHKGIDLSGSKGDPVQAVAAGRIVYAGTGIVGFGELLIVKHNDTYLSAYGHNSRLLVAEGDAVKAGQRIAEKGDTGTDSVKLHFEIRREGKPVDPLKLLPKR